MNVISKDVSGESLETGDYQKKGTVMQPTKKKRKQSVVEKGGPEGPEPTRYGDWERNGIARDF
tara:strand:+ start:389 stop:577 length:189 start_codon:yes stop_codon:yes gene_type:complete